MLPQMNAAFQAFVAPARANPNLWMLVLGVCLTVLFYAEFTFVILFLTSILKAGGLEHLGKAWNALRYAMADPRTPADMIVLLSAFIGMFAAITLTAVVLRDRSPMSLVGRGPVLQNMAIAVGLFGVMLLVGTFALHFYFSMVPNLPLGTWFKWMPIALPLLFVQITAEELIFRGYLQQELAARFKSPWIWMVLPSVIFGALHFEIEKYGSNAWLIVISIILFGLFAADVTARTGNLGAAIGLHFINNFFAMMITSLSGTLTGLSLFVTPFPASDTSTLRILLLADIGFVLFAYLTYLTVIHLKRSR